MLRLIDAGVLAHPGAQTIYHAIAHAWTDETPDTVVFATPADPHVCIGLHQDVDREVDRVYCARHGIPIVRRELGGGAVYCDRDQLFVQWIMRPSRLPVRVEERFRLYGAAIVETHRALGIDAAVRPINDVHVDGRKVCGTGAARIGGAEVVVGNFLFDFDTATMANVLRLDSPVVRDTVRRGLERYMTTFVRELGVAPPVGVVKRHYRRACEAVLGDELVDGALSDPERDRMAALDVRLTSAAFVGEPGGLARDGVKIHQDVWVRERVRTVAGATARVAACVHAGRLEDVSVHVGATSLDRLARALDGAPLDAARIRAIVDEQFTHGVDGAGVEPDDWVAAVMGLTTNPETPSGATT